jgi:hypothetical protein
MKVLALAFTALSISNSALAFENPVAKKLAEDFLVRAAFVQEEIQKPTASPELIQSEITEMLENARYILPAWSEIHTQCTAQLAKVIELYPQIAVWTPQEIRQNIEGAIALPPAEGCYPGRDVVAHPAIVRALVAGGVVPEQRGRLLREMGEAIEHMEEIAAEF